MSKYVGNFMFHPVGHGLFYSGIIKNLDTDKQYSFLYDCGGCKKSFVTSAIDNAVSSNNEIDLLIISHFHADHIKGVLELIKRKTKIRTVVLPHLDRTSKILYTAALADRKYDLQASDLEKLKNFISKPATFLKGTAEDVYFLSNNIEGKKLKPDLKTGFDFDWNYKPDKDKKIPADATLESQLWSFHFFMPKKAEKNKLAELQKFFNDNNITEKNATNQKNWAAIKKQMKKLGLNNNLSNIVCAHGPTENMEMINIRINKFFTPNFFYFHHFFPYNIGFQFLTGDAEIDDQKAFFARYKDYLEKSILFQVPHHGSVTNWKDWFSEDQLFCNLWPVTHNANHKYGNGTFPSATFSYIAPYSVTECEPTRLGIQIHFFERHISHINYGGLQ